MIIGGAALILVAVGLLYVFLIAPGGKTGDADLFAHVYAHRGLHSADRTVPENSLTAFAAARDAGYGMELDLNISRDGQVVVFHDDDLQRGCAINAMVNDLRWEELRTLRLFDTDERIPLLNEVLATVEGRVPLILELKNTPRRIELCEAAAEILDGYTGPYCVESFHPEIVRWFRRNRPAVIRGQLSAAPDSFKDQSPPVRLLLSSLLTNVTTRPHFVAYKHQDSRRGASILLRLRLFRLLGGALVGWTVTDRDDREWCVRTFDTIIFEFFRP